MGTILKAAVGRVAGGAPSSRRVTRLLLAWKDGDQSALEPLIDLVHDELLRLARRHMRGERVEHTLQTNALINEAYLRLVDIRRPMAGPGPFFDGGASDAADLIDHAGPRISSRGGGVAVLRGADVRRRTPRLGAGRREGARGGDAARVG